MGGYESYRTRSARSPHLGQLPTLDRLLVIVLKTSPQLSFKHMKPAIVGMLPQLGQGVIGVALVLVVIV
jgi:hypothetical protein